MDVGTVQSPAVNVTMPGQKAGTPVPAAESKPLAPMGTCIGANGWILLRSASPPALGVYSRALFLFGHPSMAYSRVRNAEIHVYSSEILTHHVRLSEE